MYLYIFSSLETSGGPNQLSFTLETLCWCKFVGDKTARYPHIFLNQVSQYI